MENDAPKILYPANLPPLLYKISLNKMKRLSARRMPAEFYFHFLSIGQPGVILA